MFTEHPAWKKNQCDTCRILLKTWLTCSTPVETGSAQQQFSSISAHYPSIPDPLTWFSSKRVCVRFRRLVLAISPCKHEERELGLEHTTPEGDMYHNHHHKTGSGRRLLDGSAAGSNSLGEIGKLRWRERSGGGVREGGKCQHLWQQGKSEMDEETKYVFQSLPH